MFLTEMENPMSKNAALIASTLEKPKSTKPKAPSLSKTSRALLNAVKGVNGARIVEHEGDLWITNNYALYIVPADLKAWIEFRLANLPSPEEFGPGSYILTATSALKAVYQGGLPDVGYILKDVEYATGEVVLEITEDEEQADRTFTFTTEDGKAALSKQYLAPLGADADLRFQERQGKDGRYIPLFAFMDGKVTAVVMPIRIAE